MKLFAIGIGKGYSKKQLLSLVANDSKKLVGVKNFENLVKISGDIAKMVCEEGKELVDISLLSNSFIP